MTTRGRPPNPETPSWMKALIKSAWGNWYVLPHPEPFPTRSAKNVLDYLDRFTPSENKENFYWEQNRAGIDSVVKEYLPNERTAQRIIAESRGLARVIDEMSKNPAVPLGEFWPTDSDDTAYLLALIRSFGPSFHPDFWNDERYWMRGRDDSRQPLRSVEPSSWMISDGGDSALTQHRQSSPLPLSRDEVEVALRLKGSLGWPLEFEDRRRWWIDYPMFDHELPGELAVIKELAIRQAYAVEVPSFKSNATDIFGLLAHRPWHPGASGSELQPDPTPNGNFIFSFVPEYGAFDETRYALDSIVPDGNLGGFRQHFTLLQRYFGTGSQSVRKQADDLLDDFLVPQSIASALLHWFIGQWAWWIMGANSAISLVGFLENHEWMPNPAGDVPQEHPQQNFVEIGPRRFNPSYAARDTWQLAPDIPGYQIFAGGIWCAGCRGFYI